MRASSHTHTHAVPGAKYYYDYYDYYDYYTHAVPGAKYYYDYYNYYDYYTHAVPGAKLQAAFEGIEPPVPAPTSDADSLHIGA